LLKPALKTHPKSEQGIFKPGPFKAQVQYTYKQPFQGWHFTLFFLTAPHTKHDTRQQF